MNWRGVTGADEYEIKLSSESSWTNVGPSLSKLYTGLASGTTYDAYVRGKNSAGSGKTANMAISTKPALSYPDTLIDDWKTKNFLLLCLCIKRDAEWQYKQQTITLAERNELIALANRDMDIARADYIITCEDGTDATDHAFSDYAFAVLGGNRNEASYCAMPKNRVIKYDPNNLMSGLDVMVVQRALMLYDCYLPDTYDSLGTFDEETSEALELRDPGSFGEFDHDAYKMLFANGSLSTPNSDTRAERARAFVEMIAEYSRKHNIVRDFVAGQRGAEAEVYVNLGVKDGRRRYGKADIVDYTGNIWEVKPNNPVRHSVPGGRQVGLKQLQKYINAANTVTPQTFAAFTANRAKAGQPVTEHIISTDSNDLIWVKAAGPLPDTSGLIFYQSISEETRLKSYAKVPCYEYEKGVVLAGVTLIQPVFIDILGWTLKRIAVGAGVGLVAVFSLATGAEFVLPLIELVRQLSSIPKPQFA